MGEFKAIGLALIVGLTTMFLTIQYQDHPEYNVLKHIQSVAPQLLQTGGTSSVQGDVTTANKNTKAQTQTKTEEVAKAPSQHQKLITVYRNGGNNTDFYVPVTLSLKPAHSVAGVIKASVKALVADRIKLRSSEQAKARDRKELHDGFLLWNAKGQRVQSLDRVQHGDVLFIVPRGHWFMWPGMYKGHKVTINVSSKESPDRKTKEVTLETLSMKPRVFRIDNFLEGNEAEEIIKMATPKLEGSGLYGSAKDSATRNSDQAWLFNEEDPTVKGVTTRVGDLVRIPHIVTEPSMGDHLQVVQYDPNEHYRYHHDYFEKSQFMDKRPDIRIGRNRFITVIFYLTDVTEGGDTAFPLADEHLDNWDGNFHDDCTKALKVPPKKNSAVVFYNLLADGQQEGEGDHRSMHAGCDVKVGQKWMSNKWIYNKPWRGEHVDKWIEKEGIDTS